MISKETIQELREEIAHVRHLYKLKQASPSPGGNVQKVRVNHRVLLALVTAYERNERSGRRRN